MRGQECVVIPSHRAGFDQALLAPPYQLRLRSLLSFAEYRFWHLADILADTADVCFMALSGHWGSQHVKRATNRTRSYRVASFYSVPAFPSELALANNSAP
jgi:hypothetical protein